MGRAAFIIKGPPTYLNAEEARYQFGYAKEDTHLFVIIPAGNPHNRRERLEQVIDTEMWGRIDWIETESNVSFRQRDDGRYEKIRTQGISRILDYRKDATRLADISRRSGKFETAFTVPNDLHEHLAWCLKPKTLYVIDTGNKTPSRVGHSGYIDYRDKGKLLKRLSQWTGGLQIVKRSQTSLFTAYAELIRTKHPIVANEYGLMRERCMLKPVANEIVWIGGPFCDVFGIDPMAYITYLRSGLEAAKQLFGEECVSRLTYIPNPGKESQETVNRIRQELGCGVDDTLLPVESKISRMPQLPKVIVSHYSSSLINLASVTGGRVKIISAWHHEFSHFQNLANWRQTVESGDSAVEFVDLNSAPSMFGLADRPTDTEPLFATMYDYKESLKASSNIGEA